MFTSAMTHLRDEIVSSRRARMEFRGALARRGAQRREQVSALCAGFARDRAGAHRAWFGGTAAEQPAPAEPAGA
jgi:hypothetical protein